jgi:hypothetical protein
VPGKLGISSLFSLLQLCTFIARDVRQISKSLRLR